MLNITLIMTKVTTWELMSKEVLHSRASAAAGDHGPVPAPRLLAHCSTIFLCTSSQALTLSPLVHNHNVNSKVLHDTYVQYHNVKIFRYHIIITIEFLLASSLRRRTSWFTFYLNYLLSSFSPLISPISLSSTLMHIRTSPLLSKWF